MGDLLDDVLEPLLSSPHQHSSAVQNALIQVCNSTSGKLAQPAPAAEWFDTKVSLWSA